MPMVAGQVAEEASTCSQSPPLAVAAVICTGSPGLELLAETVVLLVAAPLLTAVNESVAGDTLKLGALVAPNEIDRTRWLPVSVKYSVSLCGL